ncbi:MAG: hypothetical protein V4613_11060 [Bacteroidota bacterium]
MKYFLLIICCFSLSVYGQNEFDSNPLNDSLAKVRGVSELNITETNIDKKGKTYTHRYIYHYDRQGLTTYNCWIVDSLKHKKLVYSYITSLPHKNTLGSAYGYGWNSYNSVRIANYNNQNRLNSVMHFSDKGKSIGSTEYSYTDSQQIKQINYFNKKHSLTRYYTYDYASNGKMKHSALYKANGKLIRYWDYNCDDEGKMTKSIKDTLKVCTTKNYLADGTVITITNSFSFNGDPIKYVEYKNAQNKTFKWLMYSGKDEILTRKTITDFKDNKVTRNYIWKGTQKGKASYSKTYVYNDNGRIIRQTDSLFYTKKLKVNRFEFTYNSSGLLIGKKGFENGQLNAIYNYRYNFYKRD